MKTLAVLAVLVAASVVPSLPTPQPCLHGAKPFCPPVCLACQPGSLGA